VQARPGTYALVLLARDPATITAGALGTLQVTAGAYLYVGSAFGPGGVRARVERHARADKRHRWHVDYLTTVAPVVEVWFTHDPRRLECEWRAALAGIRGAREPWPGFGASDCGCTSHLLRFGRLPSAATFRRHARRRVGDHAPVQVREFRRRT
jgi:Uri superfamily endonuclease